MSDLATFLGHTKFGQGGSQDSSCKPEKTPLPEDTELPGGEGGSTAIYDTTPSGIEVMYQAAPKRLYRVRANAESEWEEVPSVTTVLDLIHKPALTWYGMRMGVQGVLDLVEKGVVCSAFDWEKDCERLALPDLVTAEGSPGFANEAAITTLLTMHKLTVNHRRDQAADRGTNVHDALEQWGNTGVLPSPQNFPETERGYVQGLVRFLEDVRPEPVRQEVMVGSVQHRYAGRFDLVFKTNEQREYVRKCYPKRKDAYAVLMPGAYLGDLKTSKGTYVTHELQLAAYELAAVECGYPATDGQAVIHVTEDGKYELVFSKATPEQFLAIRSAYDALKELS